MVVRGGMKVRKKIILMIAVLTLSFNLVACAGSGSGDTATEDTKAAAETINEGTEVVAEQGELAAEDAE